MFAAAFLFLLLKGRGGVDMKTTENVALTKPEKQIIELVRSLDYGELRILIKDKRPIRAEEIKRSIQLTDDKN